ncbi:MAG TPA: carboxymuconolactone decarboxylase family protein [bacterium]|nr:carboxymuconolactone decarboxylase family protein [bacterium]
MELPEHYKRFQHQCPEVWKAYDRLGAALHGAGPLDAKMRELTKLALAVGARHEGAVHAHTRLALQHGASADEIRHVVLLALTTIGFPAMMAASSWVEDILSGAEKGKR